MIRRLAVTEMFHSLFEADELALTPMTRLEWRQPELVEQAFWLMCEGVPMVEIAHQVGVSPNTLYKWRSRADERCFFSAYKY